MKNFAKNKAQDILIASKADLDWDAISKTFADYNMRLMLATQPDHLLNGLHAPKTQVVFLDDNFCDNSLSVMETYSRWSTPKWIYCLRGRPSMARRQLALQKGAGLVLDNPTQAPLYLLRARQISPILAQLEYSKKENTKTHDYLFYSSTKHTYCHLPAGFNFLEVDHLSDAAEQWGSKHRKLLDVSGLGYSQTRENGHNLLSQIANEADKVSIDLISLKPHGQRSSKPELMRSLVSSENKSVSSHCEDLGALPDLYWSAKSGAPVVMKNKADCKAPFSKTEEASSVASIPLFDSSSNVVAALRVKSNSKNALSDRYIEGLAEFSSKLDPMFSKLDFFSRVYDKDSKLYSAR